LTWQTPEAHEGDPFAVPEQTVEQDPQWPTSVAVLMHTPPQSVCPLGHAQVPPEQIAPPPHIPLAQHARPGVPHAMHAPTTHDCPAGHTVPQWPQFAGLLSVLAHTALPPLPQYDCPAGHTHAPPTQVAAPVHGTLHVDDVSIACATSLAPSPMAASSPASCGRAFQSRMHPAAVTAATITTTAIARFIRTSP